MKNKKYLLLGTFPVVLSSLFLSSPTFASNPGNLQSAQPAAQAYNAQNYTNPTNINPGKQQDYSSQNPTANTSQYTATTPMANAYDPQNFINSAHVNTWDKIPLKKMEEFNNTVVDQLTLTGATVDEVISVLEKLTEKTALREKGLPTNKMTLEIQKPISRREAIDAIVSLLSLNGIAVVDMSETFMKVVTARSALSQSPGIMDMTLNGQNPNQKICSKFFQLRYTDVNDFQRLIKPILTPSTSNLIVFTSTNSMFVTDTMANIQHIEDLIARTDVPPQIIEEIQLIPIQNIKASVLAKKLEQILKRGTLRKYAQNINIDSDDVANQLIVVATSGNMPLIIELARQLDRKNDIFLKSEVIRIKHGDATKIAQLISNIVNEQRQLMEKENKLAFERQQAQINAQGNLANALAYAASGSKTNSQLAETYNEFMSTQKIPSDALKDEDVTQFSPNLTLSPDERSNSIIVYGTTTDLSQVKSMIKNLDVLLDQVRIEVIIAQVTLSEGQNSGLEQLNISHNADFSGVTPVVKNKDKQNNEIQYREVGIGVGLPNNSSFNTTLKNFAFNAVLNQAKTDSNIKILSTPTIVTTHNRKAEFKIGENRPFAESTQTESTNTNTVRTNITYKHVGIDLTVTPLIGSNGIIQLEIEQKVAKAGTTVKVGTTESAVISDKQVNSFVSVADQDVIVLAGFQEKETAKSGGKTFLLGDIPVLGDLLFSSKSREEITTELIIFIKPTIIKHPADEAIYLDSQLDQSDIGSEVRYFEETGRLMPSKPFPQDTIIGLNAENLEKYEKRSSKKSKTENQIANEPKFAIEENDTNKNKHKNNTKTNKDALKELPNQTERTGNSKSQTKVRSRRYFNR